VRKTLAILFAVFCAVLLLLTGAVGDAQGKPGSKRHKVRKGDTLELLAAEYYGNRVHKIYIMVENQLDHVRDLKPGELLHIPISEQIIVAEGDTLAGLAETYLGNANKVSALAEVNNLTIGSTLALGQEITVPMQVRYQAKGEEQLRDIALGLFADAKLAALLQNYNKLDTATLAAGQIIYVPVPQINIQASKRRPKDADAKARIARRKAMRIEALRILPGARAACRTGDFGVAKRELISLDTAYLDADLAFQVSALLGVVYIAFDDEDSAIASFSKALQRAPKLELSPRDYSPKILALWSRAKNSSRQ